jgi:hypothetical protein
MTPDQEFTVRLVEHGVLLAGVIANVVVTWLRIRKIEKRLNGHNHSIGE